jgi:catechol 2,3-dioxygenase-like lactoylglutathione lyase family enzyme
MTTAAPDTERPTRAERCGCCGRALPASRLTELGSTPGVFICTACALWAARRSSNVPVLRLDPRLAAQWVRHRIARTAGQATMVIPILYSTDLDRTAAYYGPLGLKVIERHDAFLAMRTGSAELHFTSGHVAASPGQAFLHVPDAGKLWKELQDLGVVDVGPLEDRPSGLREFVVTDPDGNGIRVRSRTAET